MANTAPLDQTSLAINQHRPPRGSSRTSPIPGSMFSPWWWSSPESYTPAIISADDLSVVRDTRAYPYILLGIALVIALGFEFVNGFHDTANAVATVIYTNSLSPNLAVVWSGIFNFLGVLVSTGAVAFGIVSLLPVELILQVGSGAGFAMVFALLIAAILWNLGTWYFGLPSSSSHTLIGSIIGVGLMNQLMAASAPAPAASIGVRPTKIGESLLLSPLIGFMRRVAAADRPARRSSESRRSTRSPRATSRRRLWIRGLLILTCTGVSFLHGCERRPKGHGAHHADPDRHRADRLRAESHHARAGREHVRRGVGAGAYGAIALRQRRRAGRSRTPRSWNCVRNRNVTPARRAGARARSRTSIATTSRPATTRCDKVPPGSMRQHPQRHVPGQRGPALHGQERQR